jgi:hypothetical protein
MPSLQNVFYFFYEVTHGGSPSIGQVSFGAWLAHLWLWIVGVGYVLSFLGLIAIVYITMRIFDLRHREEIYYSTLITAEGSTSDVNPRWQHIESLLGDANPSHWREAIIEADIMLDDTLGRLGYVGDGVGEKLKSIAPGELHLLQDAWDVHKVRNQIAHEGSAFDLSESLAQRTIARYRAIFQELKAI